MAFRTAPHIGTPKCASYIAGMLGSITPPCLTPIPLLRERGGEAATARVRVLPGETARPVHDGETLGIDRRGALDERKRSQGSVVCRGSAEILLEFAGHAGSIARPVAARGTVVRPRLCNARPQVGSIAHSRQMRRVITRFSSEFVAPQARSSADTQK
jgi:hypothetical protein